MSQTLIAHRLSPVINLIFLCVLLLSPSYAFSFAVMGDSARGEEVFKKIVQRVNADKDISFAVHLGDFSYYGTKQGYDAYKKHLHSSRVKFHTVPGNHDSYGAGRSRFLSMIGPYYGSWDFGGCHFIRLDNSVSYAFGKSQRVWLLGDLKKNGAKKTLVFMHKPLFNISGSFPDEFMRPKSAAARLEALLRKEKVKAVFCGHIHGHAKEERGGVTYFLSGGAGSPLHLPAFSGGFHHYIKVTVDGDKIRYEVIEIG